MNIILWRDHQPGNIKHQNIEQNIESSLDTYCVYICIYELEKPQKQICTIEIDSII